MYIEMFNGWYFFWLAVAAGAIVGLYFALRKAPKWAQHTVLFGLLAFGLLLHFLNFLLIFDKSLRNLFKRVRIGYTKFQKWK